MAVFCVSYDLNKSGQNYEGLWEEIKKSNGYYHIMDSTWWVHTAETAEQLNDRLRTRTDKNDSLFLSKVNSGQYAGWLTQDQWDWLKKHI